MIVRFYDFSSSFNQHQSRVLYSRLTTLIYSKMVGCITYKFMRSNLKEFDNQKAFSAFVGFTIKTLSTRSYAMAEALKMHLLKKFGINEMFRIRVQNRRICLNKVTSTISYINHLINISQKSLHGHNLNHGQTIHPMKKFIPQNLFKIQ